jgi:hypothetical protein
MFFAEETDKALRFGDVINGFVLAASNIKNPDFTSEYQLDINTPIHSVILSPCCSIGDKKISLTPLIKIKQDFFENQYFADDLTRINRKMEPRQSVSEIAWSKMPPEEQLKRLKEGLGYALVDYFIYEQNNLLAKYTLKKKGSSTEIETNYYMIDFRNIYKINCDKVVSPTDSPVHKKELQLSIKARGELRDKITNYYSRIPKEDITGEEE